MSEEHAVKQLLKAEEFEELIKSDKLVLVDFFATWCGPCKRIAPQLEILAKENPDVIFAKLDVDELQDVAQAQGVDAMPTFKLYKKGEQIAEIIGADLNKIKEAVASNK